MADKSFSLWVGQDKQITKVVDAYDKIICMLHRPEDAPDKWGMLNPEQSPEILLSVAAFLYDRADQKLRIPQRNWGNTPAEQRLPDEKGTIAIPLPKGVGGSEPVVPE